MAANDNADSNARRRRARWRFSDGTEVELGGAVVGDSEFAKRLQHQLGHDAFAVPHVQIWPPPGGRFPLDVNHSGFVNAWLAEELDRWIRIGGHELALTSRPKRLRRLPPPPWNPDDLVPGRVY